VVDLVALLINLDRTEDAWKWVTWAEQEQVRPKDMAYLKGLLQFKQRNYPEAIAAFEAARTGAPEVEQQVDLQIALAYARDGKTTRPGKICGRSLPATPAVMPPRLPANTTSGSAPWCRPSPGTCMPASATCMMTT